LVVHGGGWRSGDKDRMERVSRAVAEAGFVAVSVNYSLAASWRPGYPRQPNELRIAVRWIRRNSYRLGVDGGRIGALGSAGGHLAALLATRTSGNLSAGDRVRAVATWSAPPDLVRPDHASLVPMIETFLGCRSDVCLRRRDRPLPHPM
jgi:acetyl esterase